MQYMDFWRELAAIQKRIAQNRTVMAKILSSLTLKKSLLHVQVWTEIVTNNSLQ